MPGSNQGVDENAAQTTYVLTAVLLEQIRPIRLNEGIILKKMLAE
jgi:hypothetical protein